MELALEALTEVKGEGRAIAFSAICWNWGDSAEEAHQELGEKVKKFRSIFFSPLGRRPVSLGIGKTSWIRPEADKSGERPFGGHLHFNRDDERRRLDLNQGVKRDDDGENRRSLIKRRV